MKKSLKDLFNVNPKYSTTLAFILGLILIDDLTYAEQNALGEWLILLGQTILTNSGFQLVIENRITNNNLNINSKKVKSIYNPGFYDINKTKDIVNKLYPTFKNDINDLSKMIDNLQEKVNNIKKH